MNNKRFEYAAKNTWFTCKSCDFSHPIKVYTSLNYVPVKNEQGINYLPNNVLNDVAEMIGYHAVNIRPELNGFAGYDCLRFEISKEPFYGDGY